MIRVTSLFNIILKIIGILYIKELVLALPNLLSLVVNFFDEDYTGAFLTFLLSVATYGVYGLMIYYFLFKTDYLIEKLKLTDSITPEEIPLNIHRSTVLSIAFMVVALLLITQAVPMLLRELWQWYLFTEQTNRRFLAAQRFDYSILLMYIVEIIIGLLIIGHLKSIVAFIELKQRKASGEKKG